MHDNLRQHFEDKKPDNDARSLKNNPLRHLLSRSTTFTGDRPDPVPAWPLRLA